MWPGCARDIALFCGRKWVAPWRKHPRLTRSCDIFAKSWHRISEHSSRDAQFHSSIISRKDAEAQELERQNTVLGTLCALASSREPLSGSPVLEQTGVGDADELLRLHETFAKLLIKFLRGRGGYDFVHRPAFVLQFREALEHCFEEGEITAQIFRRRQRPMARNDAGLWAR